jgi:hypothetical protein
MVSDMANNHQSEVNQQLQALSEAVKGLENKINKSRPNSLKNAQYSEG